MNTDDVPAPYAKNLEAEFLPHKGKIIGAVGVSGHLPDGDEECALRGIAACSLLADTGT